MYLKRLILCVAVVVFSGQLVKAEESCELQPGWDLHTHGTSSDNVWIYGKLSPSATAKWIRIYNSDTKLSKSNIAIALTALSLKKTLRIYVEETCNTFTNWNGAVRHVSLYNN